MKEKIIFLVVVLVLIVLNINLISRNKATKAKLETSSNNISYNNMVIKNLETALTFYFQSANSIQDSLIRDNIDLKNYLSSGDKIICYMQTAVCSSCIYRILQDLSKLEPKIGTGNIIFATNIGNASNPFEIQDFNYPVIYIKSFYLPDEYQKEAVIFILTKDLKIRLFYTPELLPQFRDKYFQEFLPNYYK